MFTAGERSSQYIHLYLNARFANISVLKKAYTPTFSNRAMHVGVIMRLLSGHTISVLFVRLLTRF